MPSVVSISGGGSWLTITVGGQPPSPRSRASESTNRRSGETASAITKSKLLIVDGEAQAHLVLGVVHREETQDAVVDRRVRPVPEEQVVGRDRHEALDRQVEAERELEVVIRA